MSARWVFVGRPAHRWAENNLGSVQPSSAGHPSEHTVRLGPETGWRGGGPLCPLRWALFRGSPTQWAARNHGSANNLRWALNQRHPPARAQAQGGGGADLRVRSTGRLSEDHRPDGQPKTMDRPTTPPLGARPQHPRHLPRAGAHPVLLHPVGGEGPRRGDEEATRAACVVSHPEQTTRPLRPHPNPLPQSPGFGFSGVVWWERGRRAAVPRGEPQI